MMELGKMKRISDLKKAWPSESNFSKWLAEDSNLQELSSAVGIDMELIEQESYVGDFRVDLFAIESDSDRKIVIENQVVDTDHGHLGKVITYASGKGAEIIIWIAKRARDEHRQAIAWLNQHTDYNIGFFLVEIELWQIDDSRIAPKFNVVEKPDELRKVGKMSETDRLKLEFWTAFYNRMNKTPDFRKDFTLRKPHARHWYDLSVGSSTYHICLDINTQSQCIDAGIYIVDDKELFQKIKGYKTEFDAEFGNDVVEFREAGKASRIIIYDSINVNDKSKWSEAFDWFYKMAVKFKLILNKIDL